VLFPQSSQQGNAHQEVHALRVAVQNKDCEQTSKQTEAGRQTKEGGKPYLAGSVASREHTHTVSTVLPINPSIHSAAHCSLLHPRTRTHWKPAHAPNSVVAVAISHGVALQHCSHDGDLCKSVEVEWQKSAEERRDK
jgi:hypothetical protein